MVNVTVLLGVLFGAIGATIAGYSLIRQREIRRQMSRLRDQMERKEELKELADELEGMKSPLERMHDGLSDPIGSEDTWLQVLDLAKAIVVHERYTGQPPEIRLGEVVLRTNTDQVAFEDRHQITNLIKDGYRPSFRLEPLVDDSNSYIWGMSFSDPFLTLNRFYDQVDNVQEYSGLVDQFDQDLLRESARLVGDIVTAVLSRAETQSGNHIFQSSNYEGPEEMAVDIYELGLGYDQKDEDLDSLTDVIDRIEELRRTALEASYS